MSLAINLRYRLLLMNSSVILLLINLVLAPTSIYGLDDKKTKLSYSDLLEMAIKIDRRLPGSELPKQYKKYAVDSIALDGSVVYLEADT